MSDKNRVLYIFLDEGGNLDFSPTGTKYFTLTSLSKERPFEAYKEMTDLKHDFVEDGRNIEYFHATEDKQFVRDVVFRTIKKYVHKIRVDSLVIKKADVAPSLHNGDRFYPEIIGYFLPYVASQYRQHGIKKIIVFTDVIPVQKKRKVVEKAIKQTLAKKMPKKIPYWVYHHASKSNSYLQMVDYINWAIFRKWEQGDLRSYELIQKAVKSEEECHKWKG